MNIFEFALEMEKESERHYLKLEKLTTNLGFKNIFKMLADNERNHYETIEKLRDEKYGEIDLMLLDEPAKIWASIISNNKPPQTGDNGTEIYQQIKDNEDQANDYYLKQADETNDKKTKEIFLTLAKQEQIHSEILTNIIEHITEYSDHVMDAEFSSSGNETID